MCSAFQAIIRQGFAVSFSTATGAVSGHSRDIQVIKPSRQPGIVASDGRHDYVICTDMVLRCRDVRGKYNPKQAGVLTCWCVLRHIGTQL